MRIKYLFVVSILCFTISYSQTIEDYELINQVLPNLVEKKHAEELKIYEKAAEFEKQKDFFSATFFKNYTYPTLGVDSKKVKKLIRTLDFKYLSSQIKNEHFWNLNLIKIPLKKYEVNPEKLMDFVERYGIALPIYTKDKKFAFIYFLQNCGGPDCGSATVKIYKQNKGRWIYYTQIPLWIS